MHKLAKGERLGSVNINKYGSKMEIITYNNSNDVYVRFEHGDIVHTNWHCFNTGQTKSAYDRTICGLGYIGVGQYRATTETNKTTLIYSTWVNMIKRCYDEIVLSRFPTYKGCTVVEEWFNFQNFAKWFDENYYEVEGEVTNLDKDIMSKGARTYSPDTCLFVPRPINLALVSRTSTRENGLPVGVRINQGKFVAVISAWGKCRHVGRYSTVEEAAEAYKRAKKGYIIEVAEEYKDKIPEKVYNALINY